MDAAHAAAVAVAVAAKVVADAARADVVPGRASPARPAMETVVPVVAGVGAAAVPVAVRTGAAVVPRATTADHSMQAPVPETDRGFFLDHLVGRIG